MNKSVCGKCLRDVVPGQGMKIMSIDTYIEAIYCNVCLKEAITKLNMKKQKTPDEIKLLIEIRKFLKQKIN